MSKNKIDKTDIIYKFMERDNFKEQTKFLNKLWNLHSDAEFGGHRLFVEYCKIHNIDIDRFSKLYKSQVQSLDKCSEYIKLKASEAITIWRAEIDHDDAYSHGHSWTVNKNVAKFFASRWSNPLILRELHLKNPNVKIYEATISGDDNFYYCNDRNEHEIFLVDPSIAKINGSELYNDQRESCG